MSKQYGLIIPNKNQKGTTLTRPSIFDDDSDSDSTPKPSVPTGLNKLKKQDIIHQQRALKEDPTVFQYDEVYDEMENKKKESKLARKDLDKKPKYINRLLAAADRRKRENEKRIIRQVQMERETEGEEFKDKESFVTSTYKKKLEEMKALEEQEKREEYLEAIGDVTKQGNLDGFYRHLYDQKVNYEDRNQSIKEEIKSDDEKESSKETHISENVDEENMEQKPITNSKKRKYRSRLDSYNNGNDDDIQPENLTNAEIKKEHLPSNLDADSDFSVDSSSDSESDEEKTETKEKKKDETIEHEGEKLQLPAKGNVLSDNAALAKKTDEKELSDKKEVVEEPEVKMEEKVEIKKPKIDIWKKRTIGEVYDVAVQKYFERKAARGW
ncbi:hypothetical protein ABEB36_007312 [Hypothenemus hampei]|uniref:Nuclear speckle splicing regulatory protein 1 N-terminal domain-containing protein n=1 Tax=Hypothenemus hampei TaxID=57062 RepID=A0ABD1ETR2_HYPHA